MGRFAGFDVFVGSTFVGEAQVTLKGAALHSTKAQATAVGTMRSVEHLVASLEDTLAQTETQLAHDRRQLTDLDAQVGQPFEYAEKLSGLTQRQQELMSALDLTKGQAVGSLASEPSEPNVTNEPAALYEGDWSW